MGKGIIMLCYQDKSPTSIYDVNIDRIIVSNKVPFGAKKFLNILLSTKLILKILCPCVLRFQK